MLNNDDLRVHPEIKTVGEVGFTEEKKFDPMDIVFENATGNPYGYVSLGVILMGPIYLPYFEDGVASDYAKKPLDIQDPNEWRQTVESYIVYDLSKQDYAFCSAKSLNKLEKEMQTGYIPFDHGTGQLRVSLGLIKLAENWYGKSKTNFLESLGIHSKD